MADNPHIHSKRVALLRKLLPFLAALGVLVLLLGANRDTLSSLSQSAVTSVSTNLAIEAPQFEGRLADGRRFEISAKTGRQLDDGALVMHNLALQVSDQGGEALAAEAAQGRLTSGRQSAELTGAVRLRDAEGARLETEALKVNLETGALSAPQGVVFTAPGGRLRAARFIGDATHYRFFDVEMTLQRSLP